MDPKNSLQRSSEPYASDEIACIAETHLAEIDGDGGVGVSNMELDATKQSDPDSISDIAGALANGNAPSWYLAYLGFSS